MRHKGFRAGDPHGKGHKGKHDHGDRWLDASASPRTRAQRGDVRTAILLIVAERPQNGYQIMQAISQRTGGAWQASPGAVYPAINQLSDDGLVTVTDDDGGRRTITITGAGLAQLDVLTETRGDPFADYPDAETRPSVLSEPLNAVSAAANQMEAIGSPEQLRAASEILLRARRALYLVLADTEDDMTGHSEDPTGP